MSPPVKDPSKITLLFRPRRGTAKSHRPPRHFFARFNRLCYPTTAAIRASRLRVAAPPAEHGSTTSTIPASTPLYFPTPLIAATGDGGLEEAARPAELRSAASTGTSGFEEAAHPALFLHRLEQPATAHCNFLIPPSSYPKL